MRKFVIAISVLLLLPTAFISYERFRPPSAAVADFFAADGRAEDQLADPLILTQCRAAARVAQEIQDPAMPLRRYAIGYLGNRQCGAAVSALRAIVAAETEKDYFRGDALEALAQINRTAAVPIARTYVGRPDYLGDRARAVVASRPYGFERSYWQAFIGYHE